jgi:hypothetical protein
MFGLQPPRHTPTLPNSVTRIVSRLRALLPRSGPSPGPNGEVSGGHELSFVPRHRSAELCHIPPPLGTRERETQTSRELSSKTDSLYDRNGLRPGTQNDVAAPGKRAIASGNQVIASGFLQEAGVS